MLKEEERYTFAPALRLHGLFWVKFIVYICALTDVFRIYADPLSF
jgi:hypothetical protein